MTSTEEAFAAFLKSMTSKLVFAVRSILKNTVLMVKNSLVKTNKSMKSHGIYT